jgi:hypothetical protein
MLETPTPYKKKERSGNEQGGLRRFQEREKENDLPLFLLVYYNIHDCGCNENSCFDKVKFL